MIASERAYESSAQDCTRSNKRERRVVLPFRLSRLIFWSIEPREVGIRFAIVMLQLVDSRSTANGCVMGRPASGGARAILVPFKGVATPGQRLSGRLGEDKVWWALGRCL